MIVPNAEGFNIQPEVLTVAAKLGLLTSNDPLSFTLDDLKVSVLSLRFSLAVPYRSFTVTVLLNTTHPSLDKT